MVLIKIKGHEINTITVKDSFNRRAVQFQNNIFVLLGKISVIEDDIDIPMENVALKKAPARISWYFDGHHLHYSYSACSKFVENLYVVQKLLELDVIDIDVIDKAYKTLAKEHHPDKENGDVAKFKEINHAHKVLKRELT